MAEKFHKSDFKMAQEGRYTEYLPESWDVRIITAQEYLDTHDLTGADFSGLQLEGLDLSGKDVSLAHFDNAHLINVNLTGVNASGANFEGASFEDVIAQDANFSEAEFSRAEFSGFDVRGSAFAKASLIDADLTQVHYDAENPGANSDIDSERAKTVLEAFQAFKKEEYQGFTSSGDMKRAQEYVDSHNLTGANASDCDFHGISFDNRTMYGMKLNGANLENASLVDADLYCADAVNANMKNISAEGAYFSRANLSGAILDGADCRGVNLDEADLLNVSALDANFSSAYMAGIDCTGMDAGGANFEFANINGTKFINANLDGATFPVQDKRNSPETEGTDMGNVTFSDRSMRKHLMETLGVTDQQARRLIEACSPLNGEHGPINVHEIIDDVTRLAAEMAENLPNAPLDYDVRHELIECGKGRQWDAIHSLVNDQELARYYLTGSSAVRIDDWSGALYNTTSHGLSNALDNLEAFRTLMGTSNGSEPVPGRVAALTRVLETFDADTPVAKMVVADGTPEDFKAMMTGYVSVKGDISIRSIPDDLNVTIYNGLKNAERNDTFNHFDRKSMMSGLTAIHNAEGLPNEAKQALQEKYVECSAKFHDVPYLNALLHADITDKAGVIGRYMDTIADPGYQKDHYEWASDTLAEMGIDANKLQDNHLKDIAREKELASDIEAIQKEKSLSGKEKEEITEKCKECYSNPKLYNQVYAFEGIPYFEAVLHADMPDKAETINRYIEAVTSPDCDKTYVEIAADLNIDLEKAADNYNNDIRREDNLAIALEAIQKAETLSEGEKHDLQEKYKECSENLIYGVPNLQDVLYLKAPDIAEAASRYIEATADANADPSNDASEFDIAMSVNVDLTKAKYDYHQSWADPDKYWQSREEAGLQPASFNEGDLDAFGEIQAGIQDMEAAIEAYSAEKDAPGADWDTQDQEYADEQQEVMGGDEDPAKKPLPSDEEDFSGR